VRSINRFGACCAVQVYSLFLPDVNIRRTAAWYKDGDPEDLSLDDSQVSY